MSVSNHEYLGKYVVSLAAFKAMPLEEDTMGDSIGFVFKLDAPELVVLKLPQKVANALAQEIGKMVENLPDTAFDALQHKAMEIFDQNVPLQADFPETVYRSDVSHYGKFIHVNSYKDHFKLDVTMFDNSTVRYSMPLGVAMAIQDNIIAALEAGTDA